MSELPISDAGEHLPEVAHEAASSGQVIYLTDENGHRLAAIVPADVAAEIEATEDADDIRAAEAARLEPGDSISAERRGSRAQPRVVGLVVVSA